MKKLFIALLSLISLSASAENFVVAQVDYTCINNCSSKGYQYGYCQSICSYNDNNQSYSQPQPVKQIDYACVNDCTNKGYQYQYCTSKCSF